MNVKESHHYTPTSEPKRYRRKPRISSVMNQIRRIPAIISYDDKSGWCYMSYNTRNL